MQSELNDKGFELVNAAILTLMVIIFLNLNGVATFLSGSVALLSPLILLLAGFSIISLIRRGMFYPDFLMYWYALSMTVFLVIGILNDWYDSSWLHPKTEPLTIVKSMASSIVIAFCFYLYVNYLYLKKQQLKVFKQLLTFTFIMALLIILLPMFKLELAFNDVGDRRNGLFGNPNEAGLVSNIAFALLLFFIMRGHQYKVYLTALLFIPILSTILTFSKAAMLVLIFLLLYFFFYTYLYSRLIRTNNQKWILFLFLLMIGILGLVYINMNPIFELLSYEQLSRLDQMIQFSQGQIDESTTSDRNILFNEAWRMIKENPWTGYGLGTFSRFRHIGLGCHNSFLLIWGEGGILSILMWLGFLLILGVRLYLIEQLYIRYISLMLFIIIILQAFIPTHNLLEFKYLAAIFGILISVAHNEPLTK